MPENPSTQPTGVPPGAPAPAEQRALARPVILRALVALAFGAVTVFWGTPTPAGAAWSLAAYFVGLAAARAWLLREEGRAADPAGRPTAAVRAVASACFGLAAALGLGLGAAPAAAVIAVGGAVALALTGIADVVAAVAGRGRSPLARDELIAGAVHLGAAVLLPFVAGLGAHALLGVAGGAAIITGVLLLIGGLSLRHDSAAQPDVA
ncbi:hypothetical protein J2W21_001893 [Sinomonas atrocyanea]|uniref:hypothetical protein n=1 Tax=Sinomonas atrocyanea TaxID=37927 RepID=UPI00277F094B|nr:hypothetical protein [Sinomonas atrocyanea]MDP9884383.1 hypothetical protein [Sinomonas atrocyanea]